MPADERRILITLGRLPKALDLAAAFRRQKHRVVVADPFRWHLCRASRFVQACRRVPPPNPEPEAFLEALARIVQRDGITDIVPVSEETLHVAALEDRLPQQTRLHTMSQATLKRLHDKLGFVETAAALGLPVPQTFDLTDERARGFAASEPFISKPRLSSAGHGVSAHAPGDALPEPIVRMVVQEQLPGPEISTFTVVHRGTPIGTLAYRGVIMAGTVAVCFEALDAVPDDVARWIDRFAAGTDYSGFLSFDFRAREDGTFLPIECNPRATSGVHFVEPADLAAAILEPDTPNPFRLRRERRLQQFYPALTATQAAGLRGEPWRGNLRYLFGCRDTTWCASDPLPFLTMPLTSYPILYGTIFRGESFGEASTFDIGWYDDAL